MRRSECFEWAKARSHTHTNRISAHIPHHFAISHLMKWTNSYNFLYFCFRLFQLWFVKRRHAHNSILPALCQRPTSPSNGNESKAWIRLFSKRTYWHKRPPSIGPDVIIPNGTYAAPLSVLNVRQKIAFHFLCHRSFSAPLTLHTSQRRRRRLWHPHIPQAFTVAKTVYS